jgi:hypothetical protein
MLIAGCIILLFSPLLYSLWNSTKNNVVVFEGDRVKIPMLWESKGLGPSLLSLRKSGPTFLSKVDSTITINRLSLGSAHNVAKDKIFWFNSHGFSDDGSETNPLVGNSKIYLLGMFCAKSQKTPNSDVLAIACLSSNTKYTLDFIGHERDVKDFTDVIEQVTNIVNHP